MRRRPVLEVAAYFLRLGIVGFGGPPAHLAAMHDDLVDRRAWVDRKRFSEIVGVTNLVPGPNSTEIAIHIGYLRAGSLGGLLAGLAFVMPAFLMMLAISVLYFEGGTLSIRDDLLRGIQPVALAALLVATWRLREAVRGGWRKPILGAIGLGLTVAFPPLSPLVILGAGLGNMLAVTPWRASLVALLAIPAIPAGAGLGAVAWVFLRTGLLLFGGGLVLAPLLGPEVIGRGWVSEQQFLDGIALGQATPGPVVLASVFIGYGAAGMAGALVATGAILVPSFAVVLGGTGPFLKRFRDRPAVFAFVEGITAAAIGAILAAVVTLANPGLVGWFRISVFAVAIVALALRVPVVIVLVLAAGVGAGLGALGGL